MIEYGTIVRTSVAKQIADGIRKAIVEGGLKIDERLPTEEELARRYGVSRPTIREALKRLAAQNLIRSRRGPSGGNFVDRPAPEKLAQSLGAAATMMVSMGHFGLEEIATARLELEAVCCRLAAANRTLDQLEGMERELAVQRAPATSDAEFCASDVRFHRLIVDATGNGVIRFVMYSIVEALMPVTNMVICRVRNREEILRLHKRLIAALRASNPEGAVAALQKLMRYLRDRYHEAQEKRAEAERTERRAGEAGGAGAAAPARAVRGVRRAVRAPAA
jgi:GntR family transcriptional repressor for pyruvate dehydrogenase complex